MPFVEHFFQIGIQCCDLRVKFLLQAILLLVDLVLEGTESGIELTPLAFDVSESHGLSSDLFDHLVLQFTPIKDLYNCSFLRPNLNRISMHLLNFLN